MNFQSFTAGVSLIGDVLSLLTFFTGIVYLIKNSVSDKRKYISFLINILVILISLSVLYLYSNLSSVVFYPFLKNRFDHIFLFLVFLIGLIFLFLVIFNYADKVLRTIESNLNLRFNYDDSIGMIYGVNEWARGINVLLSKKPVDDAEKFKDVEDCFRIMTNVFDLEELRWSLSVPDSQNKDLIIVASNGISIETRSNFKCEILNFSGVTDIAEKRKLAKNKSISSWVYANPIIGNYFTPNSFEDEFYKKDDYKHAPDIPDALLCIPLMFGSKTYGVVSITGKTNGVLYMEYFRTSIEKLIIPLIAKHLSL